MANKILLGGHVDREYEEGKADATITPGDLVRRTSRTSFIRHATAGGNVEPLFALNAADQNRGIDDNYAAGEALSVVIAKRGDMINALLAAGAAAIVFGDQLESAGDGTVRKASGAARAKITIGTGNAGIEFEAAMSGDEGNAIQIQYLAATAATQTVTVAGNLIQIKPNSTTPGTTDIASQIVSLVNGSAEASALVVARATGSGASAVVSPVAATNLAGGTDAGGGAFATALEAVDNSGGGSKVRLQISIK